MGRLIDADSLFPNGVFLVDKKNPMKSITELINRIANAPTAYDVEKVVAELETAESVKTFGSLNSGNRLIPVQDAIDIVKAGGVE